MKNLKEIVKAIEVIEWLGPKDVLFTQLVADSRAADANSMFVAVRGTSVDAHEFIPQVITQGCLLIVSERRVEVPNDVTLLVVSDTSIALGQLAHAFYGYPSKSLTLIGVTGTNGKTTTTTLLHDLYTNLGYKVGLLSTVVNLIGTERIPSTHTTPNPIELNKLLAQMVEEGCSYCFMEVSSHSIVQHRISGLEFKGAGFTNITHDHLDYHHTFKAYIEAKKMFFDNLPASSFALVNVDDKNGSVMLQNTKAKKYTFGLKSPADFKVKVLENSFEGLLLTINGTELWSKLIGDFNAYNLTLVYGISQLLESDSLEVLTVLSKLNAVAGRFQFVRSHSLITAIVDYAHTPDALLNVLKTIDNVRTRNEKVITVVGCGGDRDALKRPEMAKIACEWSNKVILTSDNPRTEEPSSIIQQMEAGVEAHHVAKTLSIVDREQAIKTAVALAEPNDIILIAGKGHENYQEIKGVKHHFDDFETVTNFFTKLNK